MLRARQAVENLFVPVASENGVEVLLVAIAQRLNSHIDADLVAELEAVRHGLGGM